MQMIVLVMVFRRRSRRGLGLRPVNRIKHVVDNQFSTAAGTPHDINIAFSSDTPDLASPSEVETGSTVNGFFISVEVVNGGATGVLSNAYFLLFKNPGGNLTTPTANAVGIDDNKRYVIHQEMVMLQPIDDSNPRTLFKGVIVIPRGYRRMGPNDLWTLRIFSPGIILTGCMQIHYKEFR